MGGAGHRYDGGAVEQLELDAGDGRALEDEADVGLAGQQLLHDDTGVIRVAADLEGLVDQCQQQGAEHHGRQGGQAGEPDARQRRRSLHRQATPLQRTQCCTRGGQELLAGRGGGGAAPMAAKQGLAQILFQHGDPLAHHGL